MTAPEPEVIAKLRKAAARGDTHHVMRVSDTLNHIDTLAQQCAAADRMFAAAEDTLGSAWESMKAERDAARAALAEIRDKFDCRCALTLNQACPKCIASDVLPFATLPTPTPQPEVKE